jgi:uncharacterized protein (DUF697 family)
LDTAAARAGDVASPIGACTMGRSIRNNWLKDVRIVRTTLASIAAPLRTREIIICAR